MALSYEDEIAQYKKQLEDKIKEVETRRALFNKCARKLQQARQRLMKAATDYVRDYEALLASGISPQEARNNGVETLPALLRAVQEETKHTPLSTPTPAAVSPVTTSAEAESQQPSEHDNNQQPVTSDYENHSDDVQQY